MNLSIYRDEKGTLHSLDPRTKLLGLTLFFVMCMTFNDPLYMGGIAAAAFCVAVSSRAGRALWALRYMIALLFVFSLALWPFFVKGPAEIWRWKALCVSRESLLYAVAMGLRLSTFVIAGTTLLATTRNEEITNGLIKMGLPYPFAFALSTALRLVPTFVGAGVTIIQAQVSRGLDLESKNILARFKKFIPLAVPMFITSIRYTNLLSMALESRGFAPDRPRTLFHEPEMGTRDWVVLAILFFFTAGSLFIRLFLGMGVIMAGRL